MLDFVISTYSITLLEGDWLGGYLQILQKILSFRALLYAYLPRAFERHIEVPFVPISEKFEVACGYINSEAMMLIGLSMHSLESHLSFIGREATRKDGRKPNKACRYRP